MRFLRVLIVATSVATVVAACGGGSGTGDTPSTFVDGGVKGPHDGSTGAGDSGGGIGNDGSGGGQGDGSGGSGGGGSLNDGGCTGFGCAFPDTGMMTTDAADSGNTGPCVPQSCAQLGFDCGPQGDGCGSSIDCGSCSPPQSCGGHDATSPPNPGKCGGTAICIPKTCATSFANCGPVADGCGGLLDCGTCSAPQTCGGGGTPNACGGSGGVCIPTKNCASLGKNCGWVLDDCGNIMNCGTCTGAETCGGGGAPSSVCGGTAGDAGTGGDGGASSDGGSICVPATCAAQGPQPGGLTCGPAGDGCGNLIQCGTCTAPQTCGGGSPSVPGVCGGTAACIPETCVSQNVKCGPAGDGCGHVLNCGGCTLPSTCGGGGTQNQCGTNSSNCVPETCASQNANCGVIGDGCGGVTPSCGTCSGSTFCGGGGPNQCGTGNTDAGVPCTNLCTQIPVCSPGVHTTITGTVYAPTNPLLGYGAPDPLPNALVYIPNGIPTPFSTPNAITCDTCGAPASGQPLVTATTDYQGHFTLTDPPAGIDIPLVIQIGRWRRQVKIPSVAACTANAVTNDNACKTGIGNCLTRLPRTHLEGDIPFISIATGGADPIECVLPKIGIDASEYTDPSGGGRVQFYQGNGATISASTPQESVLTGSTAALDASDLVIFDCWGYRVDQSAAALANIETYANAGGRIFASHFSYVWSYTNQPWGCGANCTTANKTVADWTPDVNFGNSTTATIDVTSPKGILMDEWLNWVLNNAPSPSPPTSGLLITVQQPRYDVNHLIPGAGAQQFFFDATHTFVNTTVPLEFTFNTPAFPGPTQTQCGRFLFSDFHVNTGGAGSGRFLGSNGQPSTGECGAAAPMTPQEKVLEFLLFDLGSCITPTNPPPNVCTPQTCAEEGFACGPQSDGCGNVIQCGTCVAPQTCGGGGVHGQCGGTACMPSSCQAQNIACGTTADGCGNLLQCGNCTPPLTCGGGGVHGQCGQSTCIPKTCAQQSIDCGPADDGCGNLIQCGTCVAPLTCGGGGVRSQCGELGSDGGSTVCIPQTCADQNRACGPAGDGCGNLLECGMCVAPQTCGGGGIMGQCGGTVCMPETCASQNLSCGPAGDGCGGQLMCGTCTAPLTCGGGGVPGKCGEPNCTPETCASLNFNCGAAGDGCGGLLQCGTCSSMKTCGGGGMANVCGGSTTR